MVQGFGEIALRNQAETSSTAMAAREEAAMNARAIMAERHPRDVEKFRLRILTECRRVGFAEVAKYSRPVGKELNKATGELEEKFAEGPSIRFVEAAIRAYRNSYVDVSTVFENDQMRIVRVVVTDYECNTGYAMDIPIKKAVEKRGDKQGKPPKGRTVISSRLNSYGDPTFLVEATDDEILVRQAALVSKAIRTQGLRILPGDIVEEAMLLVEKTLESPGEDKMKTIRILIDAFASIGVNVDELTQWHGGRDLQTLTMKDLASLRKIGAAIKEGHATWTDFMEAKDPTGSADESAKKADEILARMRGAGNPPTATKQGSGGGNNPSGTEKPEASTEQPATSATGTDGATAPDKHITHEQAEVLAAVFKENGLDDEQIAKLVKAGGADRYDYIQPALYDTILKMAKGTKGKAKK
jgi:hypothetical protein